MNEKVFEVHESGQAEVEVKKSRFIADCVRVDSEGEANNFLTQLRKKHYNARHICYAYIIDADIPIVRCSDDGEPSQTAGKPILEVMEHSNVRNSLIAVTRYFGGVLLGTGGLSRAYREAAIKGIENTKLIEKRQGCRLDIVVDYGFHGKLENYLRSNDIIVVGTEFTQDVKVDIIVEEDRLNKFKKDITELSGGQLEPVNERLCKYGIVDKQVIIG